MRILFLIVTFLYSFNLYQPYKCEVISVSMLDKNSTINILKDPSMLDGMRGTLHGFYNINIYLRKNSLSLAIEKRFELNFSKTINNLDFYTSKDLKAILDTNNNFFALEDKKDNLIIYYECR